MTRRRTIDPVAASLVAGLDPGRVARPRHPLHLRALLEHVADARRLEHAQVLAACGFDQARPVEATASDGPILAALLEVASLDAGQLARAIEAQCEATPASQKHRRFERLDGEAMPASTRPLDPWCTGTRRPSLAFSPDPFGIRSPNCSRRGISAS